MAAAGTQVESESGAAEKIDAARLLLEQEVSFATQRSRLGGVFYVAGWGLACVAAGRADTIAWAVGVTFAVLAAARFAARSPVGATASQYRRWLAALWIVALTTGLLWGAAATATLLVPAYDVAHTVIVFACVAFATAYAHAFAMRPALAFLAIALLYVPPMLALWTRAGQWATALAMAIYLVYVVLTLVRSHREYQSRLELEQELRRQRDRFEQQSRRDGLTGLANRRRFASALESLSLRALADAGGFALAILDIDHFKAVNDRHGHAVGDRCLVELARRLRAEFAGTGEIPARLGGEEFAVLMPGSDTHTARARLDAFRSLLAGTSVDAGGIPLTLGISGGVGGFDPARHRTGDDLYREVDAALYQAKSEGRNRVFATGDGREAGMG